MGADLDYVVRAPTEDDFDAVAATLCADELDDAGVITLGSDFLRAEWSDTGFSPSADAWVAVTSEGSVVGYAQARLREPALVESWGVVDPVCRGRGVGGALLDRIEARAAEMLAGSGEGSLRHSINAADVGAAGLLRARHLRPIRHSWHMERLLDRPVEMGSDTPGAHISDFDPADLSAVVAALDVALSDEATYRPGRFQEWAEEEMARPTFDPGLWRVAKEDGHVVGAVTGESAELGWISFLGVSATHRRRGIGPALLRSLFAQLAARGVDRVLVNVDAANPSNATNAYERAGMRVVKRWDLWERTIPPSQLSR